MADSKRNSLDGKQIYLPLCVPARNEFARVTKTDCFLGPVFIFVLSESLGFLVCLFGVLGPKLLGNSRRPPTVSLLSLITIVEFMKTLKFAILACYFVVVGLCRADYQTNTITTPGGVFAFSVDGSRANNPAIQLVAGVTNVLIINTASFHPVVIVTSPQLGDPTLQYSNASPQSISTGVISNSTPTTGFPTSYIICATSTAFSVKLTFCRPWDPRLRPIPFCRFKWVQTL